MEVLDLIKLLVKFIELVASRKSLDLLFARLVLFVDLKQTFRLLFDACKKMRNFVIARQPLSNLHTKNKPC